MFLSMADFGEERVIAGVRGGDELKHRLEAMGFVSGERVTVLSVLGGNLIVDVKGTRVAISRAIADKIIV